MLAWRSTPMLLAGGVCVCVCAAAVALAVAVRPLALRRGRGLRGVPLGVLVRFNLRVRLHSLLLWASGVSRALEVLPDVTSLPSDVVRVLGSNPSRMTLRGTNTYLVGRGPRRVLIDTSDGNDAYMSTLLRVCQQHGVEEITHVLLTHGHLDHMGGILRLKAAFPALQVWKYLPEASRKGDGGGDRQLQVSNADSRALGVSALEDGAEFRVPTAEGEPRSAVLRAVYTPGHYNDHVCFLLERQNVQEPEVLFSGDCILGVGSCVFDSLGDLMASLAKLQACKPRTIYPGHGPVVNDASAKIREYISHRQQREDEVLAALRKARESSRPLSAAEVVAEIYEKLPFFLRVAARKAVSKHLHKLEEERRVRQISQAGWLQSPTYSLT